jgi:predicted amidohydrolase YtcJ
MLADVVVLSADPFKIHPADLYKRRMGTTVVDGPMIYQAKAP